MLWLRNHPILEVVNYSEINQRYEEYLEEEKQMLKIIEQNSYFLSQDKNQEIVVMDFTNFNRSPYVIKKLAYLIYPQALSSLEVKPLYKRGTKTNDLSFSMALSLNLNHQDHTKDAGEIMRELNLGDGHKGAAAGTLFCSSKNEMLKQKQFTLDQIFEIWNKQ